MVELLGTKLYIPHARKKLVSRPRLVERLNAGLERKLTLIAAPAGFGKTTLLSEWIPQSPHCVTWLSLDDGDNDLNHFWVYFIASLQQLRNDLGEASLSLLQSLQVPPITSILTNLINEVTTFPDDFSIVLDDYHVIESPAIHESLTFLIAHLPENMHLVITTRVDPPLPLARLRARDRLVEIRASDLRFTIDEVAAFLGSTFDLQLLPEEIAALETRTEGWIAGLQIAALSMLGQKDISGFIRTFSGSHRHILGYLADEVLNQRPKSTLDFLLRTSVLDRLCGPLCDAVTGESGGQEMLENLEHTNLFLIPLDDEGKWYRYHHLFAEVLRARLQQAYPEMPAVLHRRASEWYQANHSIVEAVQHALAAGAMDMATQLIDQHRWALLGRGEARTLHRWLNALPPEIIPGRPGLSLAYAWILSLLEQPETIESHLLVAENALAQPSPTNPEDTLQNSYALRGEIAILRAEIALSHSDTSQAIASCQQALALLPEESAMMRGVATYFLGHAERRRGNMIEAEQAYLKATDLGLQTDNLLLALHALANLSGAQVAMGRLREAARTSQRILEITAERQRQSWPVSGLAHQGLGNLYYEWNELDTASRHLQLGIESGQRGGLNGLEINCRTVLAFVLQAQANPDRADEMLKEIALINNQNHHPVYITQAAAVEARLRLRQDRLDQAIAWADSSSLRLEDMEWPYSREVEYLTLACVRLRQGKPEGVEAMLERLSQAAEADRRTGDLIEILIQQALHSYTSNKKEHAFQHIEHALILAEREGFVRSFVDEGKPIRSLLLDYKTLINAKIRKGTDSRSLRLLNYTDKLLAAFSQATLSEKTKEEPIFESLSERELDILRLIATGRSNKEIAEILVIAVSTVKSHINNLYSKLEARNRIQAVTIAQDMGLLEESNLET